MCVFQSKRQRLWTHGRNELICSNVACSDSLSVDNWPVVQLSTAWHSLYSCILSFISLEWIKMNKNENDFCHARDSMYTHSPAATSANSLRINFVIAESYRNSTGSTGRVFYSSISDLSNSTRQHDALARTLFLQFHLLFIEFVQSEEHKQPMMKCWNAFVQLTVSRCRLTAREFYDISTFVFITCKSDVSHTFLHKYYKTVSV